MDADADVAGAAAVAPADSSEPAGRPETFVPGFHDADAVARMPYRRLGPSRAPRRPAASSPRCSTTPSMPSSRGRHRGACAGATGPRVSVLGLGASALGAVFRATDDAEAERVVTEAVRAGINVIDTAPWYGDTKSEALLGRALAHVPRRAYYLHTKVGRYRPDVLGMFDFSAERTLRSVDESLARLRVDCIDCIQVHDIEFAPSLGVVLHETLPALMKARAAGKVRRIGITGYPLGRLREAVDGAPAGAIDTVLTYCRYTLCDTALVGTGLLDQLLDARRVGVINASPLAMGLLSARGPPAWHPAAQRTRDLCARAADWCAGRGVDLSRLALHFALAQPRIPTTLVSTASLANLHANLDVCVNGLSNAGQQVIAFARRGRAERAPGRQAP